MPELGLPWGQETAAWYEPRATPSTDIPAFPRLAPSHNTLSQHNNTNLRAVRVFRAQTATTVLTRYEFVVRALSPATSVQYRKTSFLRGFFAYRQKTASAASILRPCLIIIPKQRQSVCCVWYRMPGTLAFYQHSVASS